MIEFSVPARLLGAMSGNSQRHFFLAVQDGFVRLGKREEPGTSIDLRYPPLAEFLDAHNDVLANDIKAALTPKN